MKILITGSNGFIAKNLIAELRNRQYNDLLLFNRSKNLDDLYEYCKEADFVFHLAGINRPKDESEFMEGNFGLTSLLIDRLKENNNNCPVLVTSSIQAELDNPYGRSKKAGEDLLLDYGEENEVKTYIYRLPNVFGKWCKPNYNSAVATFCHNIANDLPVKVNDPSVLMNLAYIDDVINELINALEGNANQFEQRCEIPTIHKIKLGKIVELLQSFKKSRENRLIPNMSDEFTKKLYSTYLSYLSKDNFNYSLEKHVDNRGSFTEFIRTIDRGQVSVNVSKPGITKGDHWHHTKNEKFFVVSGKGVIRFRKIDSEEVIEYFVSDDEFEVIDIPVGYTHNIENLGDTDMITIMWANELFDPERPDTYYLEV
ncbi:capsular polysaccharide biosynthesis protein CapF [Gracilibacillus thailandensis]|uniref:NAD-dependent epimerase/dehydratase family protein n=1 Tax=Gracilibacillus thailandensis TaxID=563735 RepID=A0A6N7R0L2_9BACI|nr:capsular polysaccharide biosynthesis protein CapF [Gracilibacillus thailandensis]MRI67344.1 NAD-dependent epimerase/dehydratase family protein [Gracilibacillus thailandensis]